MGCAFSRIEHNHIYNIAVKHEFFGWEIGGIKLHAAIDVVIARNNIHHCTLGTWLDWEAQGTRVTRNLYHHNDRDIMNKTHWITPLPRRRQCLPESGAEKMRRR